MTLVGQSVGAVSIALHLTSDKSDQLFHQAILQSPPLSLSFATVEEARRLAKLVAEYLQCVDGDMTCLRSKPAEEIVAAQNYAAGETVKWLGNFKLAFQPWGPVQRSEDQGPMEDFAAGNFQKKPMILGSTSAESRWSLYSFLPNEVPKIISIPLYLLLFGFEDTIRVNLRYPITSNPDIRDTLSQVLSDYIWVCSIRRATRDIESFETVPIYHYVFDHSVNDSAVWDFVEEWCRDSACHTEELFFLFYTLPLEGFSYTDAEKTMAKSMIRYWGNFVHTGDPNQDGWRGDKEHLFQSSNNSSILRHLDTTDTSSSSSSSSSVNLTQRLKQGLLMAQKSWPPYSARNRWPSMWFKTPSNGILRRYQANYCHMWDQIGYQ